MVMATHFIAFSTYIFMNIIRIEMEEEAVPETIVQSWSECHEGTKNRPLRNSLESGRLEVQQHQVWWV